MCGCIGRTAGAAGYNGAFREQMVPHSTAKDSKMNVDVEQTIEWLSTYRAAQRSKMVTQRDFFVGAVII